jgi:hypothetical protein
MRALILILLMTTVAAGQHRNTSLPTSLPAPGSPGTVTLSLSEYDRLVELALRKAKTPDGVPLPFVVSHAVFKLRLEKQTLVGTVDIDGALLENGPVKTPLTIVAGAEVIAVNTQTGASLTTKSDGDGHWMIAGLPARAVSVTISSPGFRRWQQDLQLQASRPVRMGTMLDVGSISELVTVTPGVAKSETDSRRIEDLVRSNQMVQMNTPSQNVANLQRRVAGILPVRIDVPRSGKSYRFVRPLVLDEETRITFQYKSR